MNVKLFLCGRPCCDATKFNTRIAVKLRCVLSDRIKLNMSTDSVTDGLPGQSKIRLGGSRGDKVGHIGMLNKLEFCFWGETVIPGRSVWLFRVSLSFIMWVGCCGGTIQFVFILCQLSVL